MCFLNFFKSFWCTNIKQKTKKNIILVHFWVKNTLKDNYNHIFIRAKMFVAAADIVF